MATWRATVPRSRCRPQTNTILRRRRSGRPPGNRPAMAHPFIATMLGSDLEGLRSLLAAVAGRKPTPFHGVDGADALQGIGQQWPIRSWQPQAGTTAAPPTPLPPAPQ